MDDISQSRKSTAHASTDMPNPSKLSSEHKSEDKTVSIVISSFNYENFIAQTIESALNQTYPHTEVICVDDGSTDKSKDIVSRYNEKIKIIIKENGGQASAMNAGFEASSGDIVIFLDSDDLLQPDCAESVVASWQEKWSQTHYGMEFIDESGKFSFAADRNWSSRTYPTGNLLDNVLSDGGFMHPPTTANAFSRAYLLEVMPIPEKAWITQPDIYLSYLAAFYGEIGQITKTLCKYRVHSSAGGLIKNGHLIPKRWKRELMYHVEVDKEIRKRAATLGHRVTARPCHERYYFLKEYLVWRKIDDELAADAADDVLGFRFSEVFKSFSKTTIQSNELPFHKKIAYLAWGCLIFFLPRRGAELVVRWSDPRCRIQSA